MCLLTPLGNRTLMFSLLSSSLVVVVAHKQESILVNDGEEGYRGMIDNASALVVVVCVVVLCEQL